MGYSPTLKTICHASAPNTSAETQTGGSVRDAPRNGVKQPGKSRTKSWFFYPLTELLVNLLGRGVERLANRVATYNGEGWADWEWLFGKYADMCIQEGSKIPHANASSMPDSF